MSGFIDIHNDRDLWAPESPGSTGSASTTNTSVTDDSPKNPIGFVWEREQEEPAFFCYGPREDKPKCSEQCAACQDADAALGAR